MGATTSTGSGATAGDSPTPLSLAARQEPPNYIALCRGPEGWDWQYCLLCHAWADSWHLQSKKHLTRVRWPEWYLDTTFQMKCLQDRFTPLPPGDPLAITAAEEPPAPAVDCTCLALPAPNSSETASTILSTFPPASPVKGTMSQPANEMLLDLTAFLQAGAGAWRV